MKPRWKILIAVGVFLAVFTGIWLVTMRFQPESEVEAYEKFLRNHGEKLEISELLSPPVPAESNSVNAVESAFRLFGLGNEIVPYAMRMVAPGKAVGSCGQPEVSGYDFTNSWDNFAAIVAADRPAIELLHQVLERPTLDFNLDYSKGFLMPVTHLAAMKRSVQKLSAAAISELHDGDTGAAVTNILTMLGLVRRNSAEGLMISHLVRIAMTSIAVAPTWELLQSTNVTDAQLAAVQNSWQEMDFLRDAQNVFPMERAWSIQAIEKSRASHDDFQKILGLDPSTSGSGSASSGWTWPPDWEEITERPRYAVAEAMWRSSWSYAEELRTLKHDQAILETLRMMQTNQSQFYKADYDAMVARLTLVGSGVTNSGAAFFRALKIPDFSETFGDWGLSRTLLKMMQIETTCHVIVTAIALKRFQLSHGKLPGTLTALVPEFCQSVPIDSNDGKPLKYRANADGTFLLYSVGDDGADDGGDPTPAKTTTSVTWYWQRGRDWVWPQPATEAEIKFFYAHPPK